VLPSVGDIRERLDAVLKTAVWSIVAASAFAIMMGFLCAALFVWSSDRYGTIAGCLILSGFFLVVLILALIPVILLRQRQAERAALRAQSAAHAILRDPAMLSTGLQVAKALGFKRAAPLVMLAAFVTGLMLSRSLKGSKNSMDRPGG
jgi:hypothetical protein